MARLQGSDRRGKAAPRLGLFGLAAGLAVLAGLVWAQAVAPAEMRLDTWDKTYPANEGPDTWGARKFSPLVGSGERYFYQFFHAAPDQHYLHVQSGKNNSFSVVMAKSVFLKDWPVLEWEWKMGKLPKGGDVRVKERDDQAGAMCVMLDPGLASFDSSFCYLFENDGPKDTPLIGTRHDNARYLIVRTAAAGDPVGQWLHEKRNVYEDYKRVFGREPLKAAYVGIQIDSNDTETSSEAFYRALYLRKS